MSSLDTDVPRSHFRVFLLQGKLISQLIAFWWRHHDKNPNTPQQKAAKYIGESLFPGSSGNPSPFREIDSLIEGVQSLSNKGNDSKLIKLFTADPCKYLKENPSLDLNEPSNDPSKDPNLTLITVFGKERIKSGSHYLSPIFDPTEVEGVEGIEEHVGNTLENARYKFYRDQKVFRGRLEDPENSPGDENLYRYYIPIPSKPDIELTTLDGWIMDTEMAYPPHHAIPFST
jgi:hypothetical protein